ncbi:hypothetical protein ELG72_15030 [Rhizobium leguminosarum]|uniref:hypothetical protein n=1 Tax=Rhizobium TaxID=379 RepID=UPI00102FDDBF|nr:hypothetical protein [Rhizobium leguminosarum]NKK10921.1 hypothetical protein [Rhizobium leguminosarum bv. viciae]TBF52849.1 hypothetical protein ELG91_14325 [Rhizobium leguminosarum]TBF73943.1 hypothetical protein ELG84_14255 [Rhizobium leguminosarum]TBG04829.1 hypothetical protein ELG82_15365 [Rhizobium leguminosarum]TBG16978.1 hypothetical protein ELG80_14435 [Rhizobium leguminosarum]
MTLGLKHLRKSWNWLVEGTASDVRAAFVGIVFAAISSYAYAMFFQGKPLHFEAFTNKDGVAQPLPALSRAVTDGDKSLEFAFSPPELQQTFICEFTRIEAATARELMLAYLSRYPTCFAVTQLSENTYRVFTTRSTTDIVHKDQSYFCKCQLQ